MINNMNSVDLVLVNVWGERNGHIYITLVSDSQGNWKMIMLCHLYQYIHMSQ